MPEKTPTSILSEFCAQKKLTPEYNIIDEETNPNVPIFTFAVQVLNYMAKSSGRSKSDAKHAASQALIGEFNIHLKHDFLFTMQKYSLKVI